jgi:RND family efflux transporter MFP subunit
MDDWPGAILECNLGMMMHLFLRGSVVGLALFAAACSPRDSGVTQAASVRPVMVSAIRVERRDLSNSITLNAEFRPYQEVEVHAKVSGYVETISVDVGDRVRSGQIVAVLEVPELLEELAHAAATERKSEIERQRAELDATRAEADWKFRDLEYGRVAQVVRARPGLVAAQDLDTLRAKVEQAKAQLEMARVAAAAAEEQVRIAAATKARVQTLVAYMKIAAPFSGVVTRRYADKGSMIQAGTASQTQAKALIRVAEDRVLRLVLPVPESAVARVHVGAPVEIRVEALQRIVQGRVARITGQMDQATRTMDTEVDVPNPGGVLKPGMFAHATIPLQRSKDAVAIPIQAIKESEGRRSAVVVNGSRIEIRKLKTGLETPNYVEVLDGVLPGDIVVLGSSVKLRAGQLVEARLSPRSHEVND